MRTIAIALLAASCIADHPPQPPQPLPPDILFVCYSHATCDGVQVDQRHELCARPSDSDVVIAGDAAAQDWVLAWRAACAVNQGNVGSLQGQYCVTADGQRSTWGCEAECASTFEVCR